MKENTPVIDFLIIDNEGCLFFIQASYSRLSEHKSQPQDLFTK